MLAPCSVWLVARKTVVMKRMGAVKILQKIQSLLFSLLLGHEKFSFTG